MFVKFINCEDILPGREIFYLVILGYLLKLNFIFELISLGLRKNCHDKKYGRVKKKWGSF